MLRPFGCDDTPATLRTLIHHYSIHGTFPLLVAILKFAITPQYDPLMASDRICCLSPPCPRSQLSIDPQRTVAINRKPTIADLRWRAPMAALVIGYVVAIAIVFFASRPLSINRPRKTNAR